MNDVVTLLQQIAHNTAKDSSLWVAVVAGGSAILVAALSASVGYLVASRTVRSQERIEIVRLRVSTITAERLRWLQDIRQRFSQLFAEIEMQYYHLKRTVPPDQAATDQQALDTFSAKIIAESNVIMLMLNPSKPDHAALQKALQQTLQFLNECFAQKDQGQVDFDGKRCILLKEAAFDSLTKIGIETWAQIKELK